ncbi:MAG: hypothetical protein JW940_26730 [Polyangiaceae bacterium]|nr:hypothetical protein [Polyangiaceae bacterium]
MNPRDYTPADSDRPDPDVWDGDARAEHAQDQALAELLSLACNPPELSPAAQERLLSFAFEDPLAPATDVEQAEGRRLRRALDGGPTTRDADLAVSLASAAGRVDYDLEGVLERAASMAGLPAARRTNVIYAAFGAAGVAAAAAAALILSLYPADRPALATHPDVQQAMVSSHSTAPLFQEKFAVGKASERVDLIVAVRSRELRANRFTAWGIR